MRLWYLRRAVPWTVLLGCCAAAGALAAVARRWESAAGLALPLAVLMAAAACAFVLDDAAVAVTAVTPRAAWGRSARLGAALLPLVTGLALVAVQAGDVDLGGWALVLLGIGTSLTLAALIGSLGHRAFPGAPIASAAMLLGIAPMVLGPFLDVRSPYPLPDLDTGLVVFWTAAAALGTLGTLVVLATRSLRRVR